MPQIIYNVAPTLLPPELLSPFFSYGAGFPIWCVCIFLTARQKLTSPRNRCVIVRQESVSRLPRAPNTLPAC